MTTDLMLPLGSFTPEPMLREFDRRLIEEYSALLGEAEEPSLWKTPADTHAYRLFYRVELLSAGPLLVRLTIQPDGSATAVINQWQRGPAKYDADGIQVGVTYELVSHFTIPIKPQEVNRFLSQVEKARLWQLSPAESELGADGETWQIEATNAGQFHFVHRWSPGNRDFIDLGLLLVRICDLPQWEKRILRFSLNFNSTDE